MVGMIYAHSGNDRLQYLTRRPEILELLELVVTQRVGLRQNSLGTHQTTRKCLASKREP